MMFTLDVELFNVKVKITLQHRIVLMYGGESGSGKGAFAAFLTKCCALYQKPFCYIDYSNNWDALRLLSNFPRDGLVLLDDFECCLSEVVSTVLDADYNTIIIGREFPATLFRLPTCSYSFTPNSFIVEEVV